MIQCPHCGTQMHDQAQFCPGCGTPRTFVQERLQQQSAQTGRPYLELLEEAREQERQAQANSWAYPPAPAPAYQPPPKSNRVWWILGIIAGVGLLLCVLCVAVAYVVWQRVDGTIGEGDAGAVVREYLILGTRAQYGEQWETLHPAHQEIVSREQYVDCGRLDDVTDISILLEFNEDTNVARIGQVRTRLVTYTAQRNGQTVTDAMRMVEVSDEWRWVMTDTELTVYEAGRCP